MLQDPTRGGCLRFAQRVCILATLLLIRAISHSQAPAVDSKNSTSLTYTERSFARVAGNIGGWWELINESEKEAFLDGYQAAMKRSLIWNQTLCKVVKDGVKPSNDQQAFNNQIVVAIGVCTQSEEFADFEKVSTKDLDTFYSDPVNQPVMVEWSMAYLRDKASGRKTEGQLLDALRAEQKDVHDCGKYPSLCELGIKESGPPK
jgi:hypothetical protein